MEHPWNNWIPGVLNKEQVKKLIDEGYITGDGEKSIDNSSIDLTLSDKAFKMTHGSVKPSDEYTYGWFIENRGLAEQLKPNADGSFLLRAKETYVFKLRERLERKLLEGQGRIYGQATAKSSVGRIDVLARLIVDGMDTYESFDPPGQAKGNGDMYLEITPITFNVKVKPGIALSQLRLFYGDPKIVELRGRELFETILDGPGAADGSLSVDITNTKIGGIDVAAYRAKPTQGDDAIPLWKAQPRPDPRKYWEFVQSNDKNRLTIEETKFYILRSKEKIRVPKGIAIYCRASDETIGEMRIHYAGFVHPLFGMGKDGQGKGAPLIFEVRGHQVHVSLADGEKLANLIFYRMSEDCAGFDESVYGTQSLKLSTFFEDWPAILKRNEDGSVESA